MEQYIYNEQNGLWYEQRGDYYIPCLELPAEKAERSIGVWGQRHLQYIREHKKAFYTSLLTSGKLQSYLCLLYTSYRLPVFDSGAGEKSL